MYILFFITLDIPLINCDNNYIFNLLMFFSFIDILHQTKEYYLN